MKKKNRFKPQKTGFAITGYILMWALMMAVAIVFTQALRNSVSYVFIIIVSVLPVLDLAYVFAAEKRAGDGGAFRQKQIPAPRAVYGG